MEQRKHYEGRSKQHMAYGEYYIDGSAARKVVPIQPERARHRSTDRQSVAVKNSVVPKKPMHRPSQPKVDPKKAHLEQHKQMQVEKRKQVNQKVAMRNREKALKIDWKYTMFLCGAVLAVLLSCVLYLSVQTELTQKSSDISSLRSELTTLMDANSATQERINDAIDLEYVKDYATNKLGMVYPSEDQIIKYKSGSDDYVKQYQDIPQSN